MIEIALNHVGLDSLATRALVWILCWILALGVVDRGVIKKRIIPSAQWFALHVLGNALICAFAWRDTWRVIMDPFANSIYVACSVQPVYIAVAMHLYHAIAFDNLDRLDWIHHVVSAFFTGGLALLVDCGPVRSFHTFFITGMPGGIDYAMLWAVKYGKMDRMTEKKWNARLNLWLRAPGILCAFAYFHAGLMKYWHEIPLPWINFIANATNLWNAQYFLDRVVSNYACLKEREKTKKMNE